MAEAEPRQKRDLDRILRGLLRLHGCKMEPEDFREVVDRVFSEMFPNSTVDQLQSDCDQHRDYCRAICNRVGMQWTGHVLVGRTLQNNRKNGARRLSLKERIEGYPGGGLTTTRAKAKPRPNPETAGP